MAYMALRLGRDFGAVDELEASFTDFNSQRPKELLS
jgi:hypothetical protein